MTYQETVTCPICQSRQSIRITAYGDYDGPDKPREIHPDTCPTCKGIKKANPEMWKMLSALWMKLQASRDEHRKELNKINRERFSESDLYHPLHLVGSECGFLKFYEAEIRKNDSIAKKGPDYPWVKETAMRSLIFQVAKTIAKQKKP